MGHLGTLSDSSNCHFPHFSGGSAESPVGKMGEISTARESAGIRRLRSVAGRLGPADPMLQCHSSGHNFFPAFQKWKKAKVKAWA